MKGKSSSRGSSMLRRTPQWTKLKAAAHTLPYDVAIMGDTRLGNPLPARRPLVGVGEKSPLAMLIVMRALAIVLPNPQLRILNRETHVVKTRAIAPVLMGFFSARETAAEGIADSRIRASR